MSEFHPERFSMGAYRGKSRPIILLSPDVMDPRYRAQKVMFDENASGLANRDVVLIEVLGEDLGSVNGESIPNEEARGVRQEYSVEVGDFAVILVGKDATEKGRWGEPVPAEELFRTIDAMPMRQEEMRERPWESGA